jgi:hypothetical protein
MLAAGYYVVVLCYAGGQKKSEPASRAHRTALLVGFVASFVGASIGVVLGVASAYFGGWVSTWCSSAFSTCSWRSR